jgi:hypothetical protein
MTMPLLKSDAACPNSWIAVSPVVSMNVEIAALPGMSV